MTVQFSMGEEPVPSITRTWVSAIIEECTRTYGATRYPGQAGSRPDHSGMVKITIATITTRIRGRFFRCMWPLLPRGRNSGRFVQFIRGVRPGIKSSRSCLCARCAMQNVAEFGLRDGDFGAEVDVLNGVQELDAFFHRALEGLAAGDEAGAASAFVDDGGGDGFLEIVR